MNQYIVAMLKRDEDVRLRPYKDTAIPPRITIGVGRNLTDNGISQDECDLMLANDLKRTEADAARIPWFHELNEARQAVILNMLFNLGPEPFDHDGYKDWPIFMQQLSAGDFDGAADNMIKTKWAEQVGARAGRLAQIMRTGVV